TCAHREQEAMREGDLSERALGKTAGPGRGPARLSGTAQEGTAARKNCHRSVRASVRSEWVPSASPSGKRSRSSAWRKEPAPSGSYDGSAHTWAIPRRSNGRRQPEKRTLDDVEYDQNQKRESSTNEEWEKGGV